MRTFVSFERFFINTYLLANTYVVISDDSEPSWLKLKDFQLGLARDLFHFSSKSKIGRKRAKILFSVEDLFLINFHNKLMHLNRIIQI